MPAGTLHNPHVDETYKVLEAYGVGTTYRIYADPDAGRWIVTVAGGPVHYRIIETLDNRPAAWVAVVTAVGEFIGQEIADEESL